MDLKKLSQEQETLLLDTLRSKYGWDHYDSLTDTGRKLVKDTIQALGDLENTEAFKGRRIIPFVSREERSHLDEGLPEKPKPPHSRKVIEGGLYFCTKCGSSLIKNGFLGIFGERLCISPECENSIPRIRK